MRTSLADFVPLFLNRCRAFDIKPRTIKRHESALRVHILPASGDKRVRELDRPTVEQFLTTKRLGRKSHQGQRGTLDAGRQELASGTVQHLLTTLSANSCRQPSPRPD